MKKIILTVLPLLFAQSVFATRTVYVTGRGSERTYCNANSGFFCLDKAKRDAQYDAENDARRNCEIFQRGRALTYTASYFTNCNPSYLPPNHDGTWVSCNSDCRMQCEVQN
ncbi:hypothetical protein [Bdellovibrio sp. BCCA]|uniref:hypothetical protein n=1 Tax=Bdellovibrio sp. BCCA TaxID=3136281 RepID=UPI0030F1E1D8